MNEKASTRARSRKRRPSGSAVDEHVAASSEAIGEEAPIVEAATEASTGSAPASEPADAPAKGQAEKKGGAARSPRSRNLMYTQQVGYLPSGINDEDALCQQIEKVVRPEKYAVIMHDKDVDKDGNDVAPHYHAFMVFRNPRSCAGVARQLKDKPQTVSVWDERAANGFMYLIHATDKARGEGKHQYDAQSVRANFDFPALLADTTKQVEKAQTYGENNKVKSILDMVYAGVIGPKEALSQLSGHQIARVKRQLDDVFAKFLERAAAEWRKEMIAAGKSVRVIWFYGRPGTGKTSAARAQAEKTGEPYYISGSSRDLFQSYAGEHTIILDELRPHAIMYADLLRILDPYAVYGEVMAPARYNDKALACSLYLITSPYNPREFYDSLYGIEEGKADDRTDSFEQLLRRITLTICMTDAEIMVSEYDGTQRKYVPDNTTSKPNPYSTASRPAPVVDAKDVFNEMF